MSNTVPNRVLIIQRRLTEYRVPLFERMRKHLADAGIVLQVAYGEPNSTEALKRDDGELPWGIRLRCRYVNVPRAQLVWQPIPRRLLQQQDLLIVTQENQLLFNHWLMLRRRFHRAGQLPHIAFWGHGANLQSSQPEGFREQFKSYTTRQVDWWFAYTALSVARVKRAGFPSDRITCLNNAVDTDQLLHWKENINTAEQDALRVSLGLDGRHVGVFLGSLHTHKRLDFLLKAAEVIHRHVPEFRLLIIGDGPLRDEIANYASTRHWCCWGRAQHDRAKVHHLSLGDLLLNPGMVGLSILDSFALEMPMVTTDCGLHSPEIAYLESGRNGLMVENEVEVFADAAVGLLRDRPRLERMKEACIQDARLYSIDAMADNFCNGIIQALAEPPLRATSE